MSRLCVRVYKPDHMQAVWAHGAIARGADFSEKEKRFIVAELRAIHATYCYDPGFIPHVRFIDELVSKGLASGTLDMGVKTRLQFFDKVKFFITIFLKLATAAEAADAD